MIKNIVIVGGGFTGWYTAASIKHNSPSINITVIDTDKVARLGVGETLGWSSCYDFLRHLGLENDRMFMYRIGAIYKYGFNTHDFWKDHKTFNYGKFFNIKISSLTKFYGDFTYNDYWEVHNSEDTNSYGAQQTWFELNKNSNQDLNDFNDALGDGHYFGSNPYAPYNEKNEYILRNNEGWSYHIDAEQAVSYIKELAISRGVQHKNLVVKDVNIDNNGIQSLILENNDIISSDLYIDASGFNRVLLKNNPSWTDAGTEYCNSALVAGSRYKNPEEEMHGGTDVYGEDNGWRFKVGLYHRLGNGYVFNDNLVNEDVVNQQLLSKELHNLKNPRLIKWTPGEYTQPWYKNLIGFGIGVSFIDPFDAPTFDVHNRSLEDLIVLLKSNNISESRNEYNQKNEIIRYERYLRLLFNFGLSKRRGEFWDSRRQMIIDKNLIPELQAIINGESIIDKRYKHFYRNMYYRMILVSGTDKTLFKPINISSTDREIANAFFKFNKARQHYIKQQKWPNYYQWLKKHRFNNESSDEVYERIVGESV